jgi:hypothetical protein
LSELEDGLKLNSHLGRLLFDVGGYLGTRVGILGEVDALWGEDFTQEEAKLGVELLVHIAETANKLGAETLFSLYYQPSSCYPGSL